MSRGTGLPEIQGQATDLDARAHVCPRTVGHQFKERAALSEQRGLALRHQYRPFVRCGNYAALHGSGDPVFGFGLHGFKPRVSFTTADATVREPEAHSDEAKNNRGYQRAAAAAHAEFAEQAD